MISARSALLSVTVKSVMTLGSSVSSQASSASSGSWLRMARPAAVLKAGRRRPMVGASTSGRPCSEWAIMMMSWPSSTAAKHDCSVPSPSRSQAGWTTVEIMFEPR